MKKTGQNKQRQRSKLRGEERGGKRERIGRKAEVRDVVRRRR